MSFELGIIGGTGMAEWAGAQAMDPVATPWGEPSAPPAAAEVAGRRLVFLARHGNPHSIPPHRVNYRANLWALRACGVERIVAVNAVGAIRADLAAGGLAVPDQIVDYTWGRGHTFSDGGDAPLSHVDFTRPYSLALRAALLAAAANAGVGAADGGVYAATQGPRLESAAEVRRLRNDGCDLVGMTGMPEAALARELGLEYASLCVVANPAAGLDGDRIDEAALYASLDQGMRAARAVIETLAAAL